MKESFSCCSVHLHLTLRGFHVITSEVLHGFQRQVGRINPKPRSSPPTPPQLQGEDRLVSIQLQSPPKSAFIRTEMALSLSNRMTGLRLHVNGKKINAGVWRTGGAELRGLEVSHCVSSGNETQERS